MISLVETGAHKEETAELIKLLYGAKMFEEEKKSVMKDFDKASANVYENMLDNFTVDFSKAFIDELGFRNSIMADLRNRNGFTSQDIAGKYSPELTRAIEARNKPVNLKRLPVKMEW